MPDDESPFRKRTVVWVAWTVAIVAGGLKAWATRYSMEPDTISYLDMADAYLRHDWFMALNGWWNPFYAWLLCLVEEVTKHHPYWEFPGVHVLNFGIYVVGLGCVHFALHHLARAIRALDGGSQQEGCCHLPESALFVVGYFLYISSSLYLITFLHGADLCLADFVYLAFGLLFKLVVEPLRWKPYLWLGAALAGGYLTKSVMLPVGMFFLAIAAFFIGKPRQTLPRLLVAALVFSVLAAPFVAALSRSKGRLTFSDTGRDNYALYVSMDFQKSRGTVAPYLLWDLAVPGSGRPTHPTHVIFHSPDVYEFGTPFEATYGAWADPSYWYEGIMPVFNLSRQWWAVRHHFSAYYSWFIVDQPAWVAALLVLVWLGADSKSRLHAFRVTWGFVLPALGALAVYAAVHSERRFIGAYFTLIWVCLFAGIRLPNSPQIRRLAGGVTLAASLASLLTAVIPSALDDCRAIWGRTQGSDDACVRVASALQQLGIRPGTRIAYIGSSIDATWCRLNHQHIVTEIPAKAAAGYWDADKATKIRVRAAMASTGAVAIVTDAPPRNDPEAGWRRIDPNEDLYVCLLTASAAEKM